MLRTPSPHGHLPHLPLFCVLSKQTRRFLAFTIRTEEELLSALEAGRNQPLPVLYDIKVLPGSMTPGFDSWWRVGVAEVSEMERVQQAYQEQQNHIQSVREF